MIERTPNEPLNVPLAIAPHAAVAFAKRADTLMSCAGAHTSGNARTASPRADDSEEVETEGGSYELRNGVGIVSIVGPLGQYGGWWFDGHASIHARMMRAISDPRALSITMEINSPGGIVAGGFDAMRAVRAAARESGKRIIAFASDAAYSMALGWACVADEIHLSDAGGVGSIGVLAMMVSWSRMNADAGIDVAVIRSGTQKAAGLPDLPLDPAAIAKEQAEVDRLAGIFAQFVSESRGISTEQILALQGATVHGQAAVDAGLADSVTTFQAVLARAEAAGRQRQVQQISTYLGLAPGASEAEVIGEISKRAIDTGTQLAQAKSSLEAETKKIDALATCAVDLAVKLGVVTTGQRNDKLAMLKGMPEAVARELSATEPAFPNMKREAAEGPQTGSAYKPKSDAPTVFPESTEEQLALHKKDEALYTRLRNERDAKKGAR